MTSPRTIFFASEKGANLGHLGRDLALARSFQRNGDNVILAVPNLRAAHAFVGYENFSVMQAPVLHAPSAVKSSSSNFADMLLNFGFADTESLTTAVDAWVTLFETARPDLVIYNNAPTALIAARIAKLAVKLVGSAFEIPPATLHLPSFRPELNIAADRIATSEAAVVELINTQFARHGAPHIQRVADLYPASAVCLTTLPELDPFGPRDDVAHVGPVFALPPQQDVEWHSHATRVFVYLLPSVPDCEAMLAALQALDVEVICMAPGFPEEWVAKFDRIRFYAQPIMLGLLLPTAQLVVTCGVGLLTTSLLAAVPVVYMPQTLEQHLVGGSAVRTGAVVLVKPNSSPLDFTSLLAATLESGALRENVMALATRDLSIAFEDNARAIVLGLGFRENGKI